MARTPRNNTETAQARKALGLTQTDVAQALDADLRYIVTIESLSPDEVAELYIKYADYLKTYEATSTTRNKIAELEELAEKAEKQGFANHALDYRKQASELAGGQVELLVNELSSKPKNKKAKLEAVAVA